MSGKRYARSSGIAAQNVGEEKLQPAGRAGFERSCFIRSRLSVYLVCSFRWTVSLLAIAAFPFSGVSSDDPLKTAFHQMYNSDFEGAVRTLDAYCREHPHDPLGPLSEAAMDLVHQLDHTQVLRTDFFSSDGKLFGHKLAKRPDPQIEKHFAGALSDANRLASQALRQSPGDTNDLLAKALAATLRADYDALIRQNGWRALREIKQATAVSNRLRSHCQDCYDAYLASGVENYILGHQTGVRRLFLNLTGVQTNERNGLQDLRLVAEKGRWFAPYAKVLLAIAAIRDNHRDEAVRVLSGLAEEFPGNEFFRAASARSRS